MPQGGDEFCVVGVRTSRVHFPLVVAALEIFADVVEASVNVDVFLDVIVRPQLASGVEDGFGLG